MLVSWLVVPLGVRNSVVLFGSLNELFSESLLEDGVFPVYILVLAAQELLVLDLLCSPLPESLEVVLQR